jgi:hypothetical protein
VFDGVGQRWTILHEWGRRGSPRADIWRGRSHGPQQGFQIPPGSLGLHIYIDKIEHLKKIKTNEML